MSGRRVKKCILADACFPSVRRAEHIMAMPAAERRWSASEVRQLIGEMYTSPFDVELEPDTIVQPDVFVLPPREAERVRTEMPARELLVAAEVLSPSSSRGDRVTKRPLYGRRVPEYWILDLDARLVERWPLHARQPE